MKLAAGRADSRADIPKSVSSIADDAFNGHSSSLAIYGANNSTAQTYAQDHNIQFEIVGSGDIVLPEV